MEFVLEPTVAAALFWLITAGWLLEPLLFRRRPSSLATTEGRRELRGIAAALVAALLCSAALHRTGLANLEGAAAAVSRWLGLGLYATGVCLRYWAAHCLGPWFTRDLEVRHDHRLVSRGPYRRLRHPLYTGLLLVACGMSTLFANPLAAALSLLLVAASLLPRMRREERLLEERLGAAYVEWKDRRYRLLPLV